MRCALAIVVVATAACGRTSPELACPEREGLLCGDLAKFRGDEQSAYAAAVVAGDADTAALVGTCNQSLVNEQVERGCIADPCVDLCSLHPCALVDDAATCEDGCHALGLDDAVLDIALVKAAANPTFCTCAVCDDKDGTAPLCTDLWLCAS